MTIERGFKVCLVGLGKWVEVRYGPDLPTLNESVVKRKHPRDYYGWADYGESSFPHSWDLKVKFWEGGKVVATIPRAKLTPFFRGLRLGNGDMKRLTSTQVAALQRGGLIP